jgi:hypothetical protein
MTAQQLVIKSIHPDWSWEQATAYKPGTDLDVDINLTLPVPIGQAEVSEALSARIGPGKSFDRMHVWPKGQRLLIWGRQADWRLVTDEALSKWGWSHVAYLKEPLTGSRGPIMGPKGP